MNEITSFLGSLGLTKEKTTEYILLIVIVFSYIDVKREISHVKEILNHHITELKTGQDKLEKDLKAELNKLDSRIDRLDGRIDRLDSRVDKLINTLLGNKVDIPKKSFIMDKEPEFSPVRNRDSSRISVRIADIGITDHSIDSL